MARMRGMNTAKDPERSRALKGNQNAKKNGAARGAVKSAAIGGGLGVTGTLGLMKSAGTLGLLTATPGKAAAIGATKGALVGGGSGFGLYHGLAATEASIGMGNAATLLKLGMAQGAGKIAASTVVKTAAIKSLAAPAAALWGTSGAISGGIHGYTMAKIAPKVVLAGGLIGATAGLVGYGAYKATKYLKNKYSNN